MKEVNMSCSSIPEHNLEIFKGDGKTFRFRYKAGGEVVDITGYTILLETKIVSLQKTAIVDDPITGEFSFVVDGVDTVDLTQKRVKYKVVFYPTGLAGERNTKFTGSINITSKGIT